MIRPIIADWELLEFLEELDPDWTDHFVDPDVAIDHYFRLTPERSQERLRAWRMDDASV